MIKVELLNPEKITPNGYYFDIDSSNMFPLSDEEILSVRRYYRDFSIASNRLITKKEQKRSYKIDSHQKYNDGKHRSRKKKNSMLSGIVKYVAVGGIMIAVTVYSATNLIQASGVNDETLQETASYYQIENESLGEHLHSTVEMIPSEKNLKEEIRHDLIELYCQQMGVDFNTIYAQLTAITNNFSNEDYQNGKVTLMNNVTVTGENESQLLSNLISVLAQLVDSTTIEESVQKQWIKKYCDIYQVNFDIVYNRLVELTNNFTDKEYLNGHIPGITCKGIEVYANSEEELILYFVRCAKQLPQQVGLSQENLYVQNGYQSSTDYGKSIGYYSKLLGTDPFLVYSIVQAETSWNSPLFLDSNNPAGLRNGGKWWTFSTKEEGFIELILEILKYNRLGASTIEEIGQIHAPTSDPANVDWVPNVTMTYNDISINHRDLVEAEENIDYYSYR